MITTDGLDRNTVIKRIKTALQCRSGKQWSVTGGRGTAYGWITIDAPPSRRTSHHKKRADATMDRPEDYEDVNTGEPDGHMTLAERVELGRLLGLDGPVHCQGESIAASNDHYREYIDRAEGRKPAKVAEAYWD